MQHNLVGKDIANDVWHSCENLLIMEHILVEKDIANDVWYSKCKNPFQIPDKLFLNYGCVYIKVVFNVHSNSSYNFALRVPRIFVGL